MVIYSDKELLAVNKRPGDFVQSGKNNTGSLIETLKSQYGELFPVHRLDAPVSGVVVFARTKAAAASLSEQFRSGADGHGSTLEKRYICAVDNPPPSESGRLENNIFIESGKKINKVFIKDEPGKKTKKAILDYKLIFSTENYFILEVVLVTGRKHQIRAQLANAGCHIKGDVKYGARRTNRGGGISLHSLTLSLKHPSSGEIISFYAEPPEAPLWNALKASGSLPAAPEKKKKKENE